MGEDAFTDAYNNEFVKNGSCRPSSNAFRTIVSSFLLATEPCDDQIETETNNNDTVLPKFLLRSQLRSNSGPTFAGTSPLSASPLLFDDPIDGSTILLGNNISSISTGPSEATNDYCDCSGPDRADVTDAYNTLFRRSLLLLEANGTNTATNTTTGGVEFTDIDQLHVIEHCRPPTDNVEICFNDERDLFERERDRIVVANR